MPSKTPTSMSNLEGPAIVVVVVGPAGSGKSMFINTLLQEEHMLVTKSLADGTRNIQVAEVSNDLLKGHSIPNGSRLFIADTPGFDSSDVEAMLVIEAWLKKLPVDMELRGFIYLHDISNDRVLNDAMSQNFRFLRERCGCTTNELVIGTTKWGRMPLTVGQDRERELIHGKSYWKPLIEKGARVQRFEDTHSSAINFLDSLLKKDMVIVVMGRVGSGKSSFINKLLGEDVVKVGHRMKSCTQEVQTIFIDNLPSIGYNHLAGYRLVIVDTPGFDDTDKPEAVILRKIADWLEQSYRQKEIITGVIYLHDISNNRFTGPARRNFNVFQCICGDDALKKVVLGTTMWDPSTTQICEGREEDLKRDYWRPLIDKGSKVERFHFTKDSAWKIVAPLLNSFAARSLAGEFETVLQIQKELVDDHRLFFETEAGKQVLYELKNAIGRQEDIVRQARDGNRVELERDLNDLKKQLRALTQYSKKMKAPIPPKLRRFLDL